MCTHVFIQTRNIADDAVTGDKIADGAMKRWVPDYSKQKDLGAITTYTATECGWIIAHYYGYSTSGLYRSNVLINNKIAHSDTTEATAPNNARTAEGKIMLPISAGDVVTGLSSGGGEPNSYFVPGKWV